uniref:Family with sequence similarity 184 member B n=1 Tax=Otus sunia TaxID=257818 RepID=A0A8C8B367_9STRI
MASGINKIHQPGTCSGSKAARSSSAEERSQEMHVKMCKKIAQLTKVIYALNTKNDEHEASIQALREAHEEEIQHILAETRETILQCKSKAEEEQVLRKRIQALEIAVEHHKRLKEEALAELTLCKKQVEEREPRTEAKQAQTVLSTNTVDTNADFENKLLHLNRQSDGLLNECKASRRANLDKNIILDEKYNVEGQTLINEMKNLKRENQRATEEYAQKTSKLQASYEREKEDLKNAMKQSGIETKKNCQQREMEQRKSSEAEEGFLLQQVKKLEADLEEKSQKINERKKHSQKLKERIQVEYETAIPISAYKSANYQFFRIWGRRGLLNIILSQILCKHSSSFREEFKRKSECELKQLEKDKEVLTGKLQKSSYEVNQVAQLKQILDQQANNFKESLKKHNLQSNKEKEKLLQDLQNTIKENQKDKLQLEASHQKVLKMLEKSKNQELKAEERLKKEFNETFKIQHQSHRLEIQTLEEKAKKELHDELEQIQKQQTLLLGIMSYTSKLHALRESRSEDTHLISCVQDKLSEREEIIKQLAVRFHFIYIYVFWNLLEGSFECFTLLQTDSFHSVQEYFEKYMFPYQLPTNRCFHIHNFLFPQEGRKFQHSLLANTESYRNRSFSFNPNTGCLTPSMKTTVEVPSRVVSVPNLASYAKSFLSCDLRSKRSAPQITKSTSLDRSPGCLRVGSPSAQPSDSSAATRYLTILQ